MRDGTIKSDILLLITAVIWGFAFVAQRIGMEYVGPFTFNGTRFLLGCLVLIPFIVLRSRRFKKKGIRDGLRLRHHFVTSLLFMHV